jgi:hypothetical protein
MPRWIFPAVLLTALSTGTGVALAQPPTEPLPPPRALAPVQPVPPPVLYPPPVPYRVSRYEVWQYYGVDWTGHFRPRVIDAPYDMGGYYLYRGIPYPWVNTHTIQYMPYARE